MAFFSEALRQILKERNIKQSELARMAGINKSSISEYLSENYAPKYNNVVKIARALEVPLSTFLEDTSEEAPEQPKKNTGAGVPIVGRIAAGMPLLAQENIEGYMPRVNGIDADFCLRISGDSMINARICDGDIVYIKQQPEVENGEIAAVLINDSATLKRVYKEDSKVELHAENPKYKPMVFNVGDCDSFLVLGKAIALYSKL